jgi:IS30 family transposase
VLVATSAACDVSIGCAICIGKRQRSRGRFAARSDQGLRTGRGPRRPCRRPTAPQMDPDMINISERPAEADDRAVPGHWEGDLILGHNCRSAIGRQSRTGPRRAHQKDPDDPRHPAGVTDLGPGDPKGTDLSVHTAIDFDWVATELNDRPRKRLGFANPIGETDCRDSRLNPPSLTGRVS